MSHDTEKLHGPVFGTAHTVAEVMENARRRVDTSVADAAKDQRIHDLEREVERLGRELADARDECHDHWTPTEVAAEAIIADRAKEGGETATGHADYDPPCTDCWDTGVTTQTERHCSCEAGMRRRVSDAAMAKEGEA